MKDNSIVIKETSFGLLKGAIGAIPFFGSAINEALFDIEGRIQQKRINDFVIQLSNQVDDFKVNIIDNEYLKSQDFYDLTRIIFESVMKVKSEQKQLSLSKVYLNAIINKSDIEQEFSILFSKFIIDLIPLQIQIISFIEKFESELIEIGSYQKFYNLFIAKLHISNLDKYEFKYSCNDLENKTIISLGGGLNDFDSTTEMIVTTNSKEESVKLTSIGKRFIEILK